MNNMLAPAWAGDEPGEREAGHGGGICATLKATKKPRRQQAGLAFLGGELLFAGTFVFAGAIAHFGNRVSGHIKKKGNKIVQSVDTLRRFSA